MKEAAVVAAAATEVADRGSAAAVPAAATAAATAVIGDAAAPRSGEGEVAAASQDHALKRAEREREIPRFFCFYINNV